jgi:hypothetical protein
VLFRSGERPRPSSLGRLEVSVTPPPGLPDLETVRHYAELGVDRLILLPPPGERDDLLRYVADTAATLIGRA